MIYRSLSCKPCPPPCPVAKAAPPPALSQYPHHRPNSLTTSTIVCCFLRFSFYCAFSLSVCLSAFLYVDPSGFSRLLLEYVSHRLSRRLLMETARESDRRRPLRARREMGRDVVVGRHRGRVVIESCSSFVRFFSVWFEKSTTAS